MAAVHGQSWMGTAQDITRQVNDTLGTLINIRNNIKVLRDRPEWVYQNTGEARDVFISWNEQLYAYTTSVRCHYARDDQAHQNKQLTDHYEKKIAQLTLQLSEETKAKDSAMSRVSELASRLLKSGNPGITELSDPNRPMKLAEQFSTTYDDEWTDAFEFLTEQRKLNEKDTLNLLYDMLKKCHEICTKASDIQYNQLETIITTPTFLGGQMVDIRQIPQGNQAQMSKTLGAVPGSKDVLKGAVQPQAAGGNQQNNLEPLIKDFRKMIATETWKNVQPAEVLFAIQQSRSFRDDILKNADISKYLSKCAQLCWLMGAQYPPMIIEFSTRPGDQFIPEKFKEYRTRGSRITIPVWPPVYLHQGGPLICKGYAEGDGKK